ncbi:MAG: hypothetical protein E7350_05285 [Clostridiales bacterium]|nr:hypothetical protein [Clostridiales bacterium]
MKKRKITYSLSARQKRQLKQQEQQGEKQEQSEDVAPAEVIGKRKPSYPLIICITAVALAVVLIFLAIFIPIWSREKVNHDTFLKWKYFNPDDPENPYSDTNPNPNPAPNPIATVTLTGEDEDAFKAIFGEKEVEITLEIFMDDAPYAGMNFMYLAESGFYDGTIIHDVYRGKAAMNGFTQSKNSSGRAKEATFIRNLKGFVESNVSTWNNAGYKLGYRLKVENDRSIANTSQSQLGYLLMVAGNSSNYSTSTSFILTTDDSPVYNYGDGSTSLSNQLSWLGRATNDESLNILRKLNGVEVTANGKSYVPNTTIRIESIKTNLSKERKKYLLNNFESLIAGGKETALRNVAYNESYYNFKD